MAIALAVLAAYLLGSISFAIVVSRLMRLPDPRSYGSKNPGATNVLRTGKIAAAVLTLAGDAAKGWLAAWLAGRYLPDAMALAGLAAFLGHLFPVYHRFQGGKGVATAAGVLFGFNVWLGAGTLVTWLVIAGLLRYASLASIVAALFAAFYAFWLFGLMHIPAVVAVMAALLVWRHRENIRRLLAGTESRLGQKSASPPPPGPNAASR
ncbi:MAG TPA: glycerol-3-phosphate 1-O-acyltransferase PlsY [Burkholderiales bacterium]